jgi:hypothetical protein
MDFAAPSRPVARWGGWTTPEVIRLTGAAPLAPSAALAAAPLDCRGKGEAAAVQSDA